MNLVPDSSVRTKPCSVPGKLFAKGEHDRANEICRRVRVLERGEFVESSHNKSQESFQPAQPTWAIRHTEDHTEGPLFSTVKPQLPNSLERVRRELLRKLNAA